MIGTTFKSSPAFPAVIYRSLRILSVFREKGDNSTIDAFKFPSQTSINEWEYRYDLIHSVGSPKIPAVNREAVRKDIVDDKVRHVANELFIREANASIKVEANNATVVHGGECVSSSPESISIELDPSTLEQAATSSALPRKFKKLQSTKYFQTSINLEINESQILNLGEGSVHSPTKT